MDVSRSHKGTEVQENEIGTLIVEALMKDGTIRTVRVELSTFLRGSVPL